MFRAQHGMPMKSPTEACIPCQTGCENVTGNRLGLGVAEVHELEREVVEPSDPAKSMSLSRCLVLPTEAPLFIIFVRDVEIIHRGGEDVELRHGQCQCLTAAKAETQHGKFSDKNPKFVRGTDNVHVDADEPLVVPSMETLSGRVFQTNVNDSATTALALMGQVLSGANAQETSSSPMKKGPAGFVLEHVPECETQE